MLSRPLKSKGCAACRGQSRARSAAGMLIPGGALLLIPKCPLCIAAYIAAFSGLGVSVTAAAGIRYALITACVLAIGYFAFYIYRRSIDH